MIYLKLFWSFLQIGLFSIGGGYAAMPLIQHQVVEIHQWLTMSEFTDLITIAEMTPGPIAINSATFVGIQIAGFSGAVISTLGCIFPSCIIVSGLAYFYYHYKDLTAVQGILGGLRPAVVAMIASAGLSILSMALFGQKEFILSLESFNVIGAILFAGSFIILRKWKPNPVFVMGGAGVIGMLLYLFVGKGAVV